VALPAAQGSPITVPANLAVKNSYLIFAEVSYAFTPMFGYFSSGSINFPDNLYTTRGTALCVVYTPEQRPPPHAPDLGAFAGLRNRT